MQMKDLKNIFEKFFSLKFSDFTPNFINTEHIIDDKKFEK